MKFLATATAAALALTAAMPVVAQTGYYSATPKAAVTKTTFVTRSALWKCADGVCNAGKAAERDAVLCEVMARKVGPLSAFSVGGSAYSEESLARCNAKAR